MPASPRSLAITDAYRERLFRLRDRAEVEAGARWAGVSLDDLEGTHASWVAQVVATLEVVQRASVRLTAAYLSAYIASERRTPAQGIDIDESRYVRAEDGRSLSEALASPAIIAVRAALKDGKGVDDALQAGLQRGRRLVGAAAVAAPRAAMEDTVRALPTIIGWRRVTAGGCGACIAAATGAIQADSEVLLVHDHCSCTKEPVIAAVPDIVQRPTGPETFAALPSDEQDARLGSEKAALLRSGEINFESLIDRSPMASTDDRITEAPLEALRPQ